MNITDSPTSQVGMPSYDTQSSDLSALLPLKQVLNIVPLSRSSWLNGVRRGIYPQPIRLSPRRIAWLSSEVISLVETFINSRPSHQLDDMEYRTKKKETHNLANRLKG